MKLGCKENHWKIKDGQLVLDTPEGQEAVKDMIKVLEREIRLQVYYEICGYPFTDNRKEIMKHGLENSLLMVQNVCAKIALGENDASRQS
jgi:hypothetical protein